MSKYEGLRGGWVIPCNAWSAVKKGIRADWNLFCDTAFSRSLALYRHPEVQLLKGRSYGNLYDLLSGLSQAIDPRPLPAYVEFADPWMLAARLHPETRRYEIARPRKKDVPRWTNRVTAQTLGGVSVAFVNNTRTIRLAVEYNNHALNHAETNPLYRSVLLHLRGLSRRKAWTQSSGGAAFYRSEFSGGRKDVILRHGPAGLPV